MSLRITKTIKSLVLSIFLFSSLSQAQSVIPLYNCFSEKNSNSLEPDFQIVKIVQSEILDNGYYIFGPKPLPVEYIENPAFNDKVSLIVLHRTLFTSITIYKEHKKNAYKALFSDILRDVNLTCVKQ